MKKGLLLIGVLCVLATVSGQVGVDVAHIFKSDTLCKWTLSPKRVQIHDPKVLQSECLGVLSKTEELLVKDLELPSLHGNIEKMKALKKVAFRKLTLPKLPSQFANLSNINRLELSEISGLTLSEMLASLHPSLTLSCLDIYGMDIRGIENLAAYTGKIDTLWVGCSYENANPAALGLNKKNIQELIRVFNPQALGLRYYIPLDFMCGEKSTLQTIILKGAPFDQWEFTQKACNLGEIPNVGINYEAGESILKGRMEMPFVKKLSVFWGGNPNDTILADLVIPHLEEVDFRADSITTIEKIKGVDSVRIVNISAESIRDFHGLGDFQSVELLSLTVGKNAILPQILSIILAFPKLTMCHISIDSDNPYLPYFMANKNGKIKVTKF